MNTTTTRNVIGTIQVPAGEIHRANYETAAWYTTFVNEAQECEVVMDRRGDVSWTIQGRRTYEYFPSLWGGVAIGGGRIGPCDEPDTHTVYAYGYTAAAMVEAGEIALHDGYRVEESFFDHPVSCSGYTIEGVDGKAVYTACEHDLHEDAHYRPTVTERSSRGFLPFGYAPGVKDRKRHIRVVPVD